MKDSSADAAPEIDFAGLLAPDARKEEEMLLARGYAQWEVQMLQRLELKPTASVTFETKAEAETARLRFYNVLRYVKRNADMFPLASFASRGARLYVSGNGRLTAARLPRAQGPQPIGEIE